MIAPHVIGPSVLSEVNLPNVKQEVSTQTAELTREITTKQRQKNYQEAVFCGRKICAQTTSILFCPIMLAFSCICSPCDPRSYCNYSLVQKRGGWKKCASTTCCPKPAKPAEDSVDCFLKCLDPTTICRPCQEPALYYSTPTERNVYEITKTSLETLRSQKTNVLRIKELFEELDALTPRLAAPVQQIMIEYIVTATPTGKKDPMNHSTYSLTLESST